MLISSHVNIVHQYFNIYCKYLNEFKFSLPTWKRAILNFDAFINKYDWVDFVSEISDQAYNCLPPPPQSTHTRQSYNPNKQLNLINFIFEFHTFPFILEACCENFYQNIFPQKKFKQHSEFHGVEYGSSKMNKDDNNIAKGTKDPRKQL